MRQPGKTIRDLLLAASVNDPSSWPHLVFPLKWKDNQEIHPDVMARIEAMVESGQAIWDTPIATPPPRPDRSGSKYIPKK